MDNTSTNAINEADRSSEPQIDVPETMRSVGRGEYGGPEVLRVAISDTPTAEADQILIKVHASSVNPLDWHVTTGTPQIMRLMFGIRRPKNRAIGADLAGEVVAVGSAVTEFAIGDRVYAEGSAAWSDYAVVREAGAAHMPRTLTFAQAATYPVAALTAIQALRDWGRLKPGQTVLINGASGGVGIFAVQFAKLLGASEVVAVCSGKNADLVSSLGADRVIDYTKEDFVNTAGTVDVFVDNIGHQSLSKSVSVLNDGGAYVMVSGKKGKYIAPIPRIVRAMVLNLLTTKRLVGGTAKANSDDLRQIAQWTDAGNVRAVIDRTFTLEEASEALAYLATNRTRGKSVIQVVQGDDKA